MLIRSGRTYQVVLKLHKDCFVVPLHGAPRNDCTCKFDWLTTKTNLSSKPTSLRTRRRRVKQPSATIQNQPYLYLHCDTDESRLHQQKRALERALFSIKSRSYPNGLSPKGLWKGVSVPFFPPPCPGGSSGGEFICMEIVKSNTILFIIGLIYTLFFTV